MLEITPLRYYQLLTKDDEKKWITKDVFKRVLGFWPFVPSCSRVELSSKK